MQVIHRKHCAFGRNFQLYSTAGMYMMQFEYIQKGLRLSVK